MKNRSYRCKNCGFQYALQGESPVCAPDGIFPDEPADVFYNHVGDDVPLTENELNAEDRAICPKCGEPMKAVLMENSENAGDKP